MNEPRDHEFERRVRNAYGATPAPGPEARERLDRALANEPAPVRRARGLRSWLEPRAFEVSPLVGWSVAAALVFAGIFVGRALSPPTPPAGRPADGFAAGEGVATSELHLVRFALVAPRATRVAVVGDFNGWDASATPMRRAEGDAWVISLPIASGRHLYAFVVDGERWIPDPSAPLAPEDGFGLSNSVIVVGTEGAL